MQKAFQHIAAAALLVAVGAAQAAEVTVPAGSFYNGVFVAGAGSLTFSSDLLAALDTAKVSVAAYGSATGVFAKDSDNYYTQAAVSAPLTSLTIDTATSAVSAATTSGGATFNSTTPIRGVILTGSLTVTDLSVDLVNKLVYGTIIGGNNVGTKTEALWTVGSITGAPILNGVGTYTTTLTGLKLTTSALDDFSTALGLQALGKTTLGAVANFGTINSTIIARAVPEPSTYALMGLGLIGVGLVARRRKSAH